VTVVETVVDRPLTFVVVPPGVEQATASCSVCTGSGKDSSWSTAKLTQRRAKPRMRETARLAMIP
jgi:hypothetical protein